MYRLSRFLLLSSLLSALILTSCSFDNVDQNIEAAEFSLSNNDYSEASEICHKIAVRDSLNDLTTSQLCRLSIIYMRLSENRDEDVNVAMATRCFHMAMEQDSLEASVLYNDMPIDDQHWIHFLAEMNKILDSPRDFFADESTDTVFISGAPMIIDDIEEQEHTHN